RTQEQVWRDGSRNCAQSLKAGLAFPFGELRRIRVEFLSKNRLRLINQVPGNKDSFRDQLLVCVNFEFHRVAILKPTSEIGIAVPLWFDGKGHSEAMNVAIEEPVFHFCGRAVETSAVPVIKIRNILYPVI